ncbi:disks large-associated protein 5 [Onthophagus taurus]|uniref:disks large-associated protein 5 n=1 Tax=Onthophagus taurus TaxID=166361 RepID=UPI0039BDC253
MEDPSRFQQWFKPKFRVSINKKQRKEMNENRRNKRNDLFMEKRGIRDLSTSPEVIEEKVVKNPRLLALKAWKEKRNKEKLEKQANKKPIFKVQHISIDIGAPNLEFINKTIKGKRFDIKSKKTKKDSVTVMGFKVSDIKQGNDGITSRLRSKTKPSSVQNNLKSTNTQKATISNVETKRKTKNVPEKKPNHVTNNKKKPLMENNKDCSPVKQFPEQSNNYYTSPVQQKLAAAYVSPFVTITRGKSSARKEYKMRRSQGGLFDVSDQLAKATGNQAGAAHFHQLLNAELERIEKMCDDWIKYKDDTDPPEEACDMINTAIGQSKLLINKKFQRFRGLIIDCEMNNSVKPVTCTDLHGYWEVICLEIDDVNKRFEYLNKLCNNNWEEILPIVNKPQPKRKVIKKASKPSVQTQSSLRDLIKEKRLKFKENAEKNENIPPVRVTRSSLSVSFKNNDIRESVSSPDLTMVENAFSKKRRVTISADSTPAKGILKTPHAKSSKKKLVLFRSNAIDIESPPIAISKPRRSSKRISKMLQDRSE